MAVDRSFRSLMSLSGASSSRVLNLTAIGLAEAENAGHAARPMFASRILNSAIVLKHRLRADEMDMFVSRRVLATKIIVPFEKTDLRAGGRSMFVDQRGFEEMLRDVGNHNDETDFKRDVSVLRLMDRIPSLDPFLLREQLRGSGIDPDPSYFAISQADQQRMHNYAAGEISRLTAMASGKAGGIGDTSTARMVTALLSHQVNEKLEPLRATLNLQPDEFSEGVFSWRGFIYYKWSLVEFWPNLIRSLKELKMIMPVGKADTEQRVFLSASKNEIVRGARTSSDAVRKIIAVYDDAYASLIERQDPRMFRDFLLSAPQLFLEVGEKMGAMSHVTSFWQYRFPAGSPRSADADELTTIFEDFIRSFGRDAAAA
ncbi:MAG: hypothetical protein JWP16_1206 [Alphaproteobacteria bacterium]|nr:hypothetical protein [Alphaproteobacteria bacterium]